MRKEVEDVYLLDDFLASQKDKSRDFKALTIKLLHQVGNVSEVSKFTNVPEQTIYDWLDEWSKKNNCFEQRKRKRWGKKS